MVICFSTLSPRGTCPQSMPAAEYLLEQLYKVLLLLGLFYQTRNVIVFPLPKTFLSSFPHFAGGWGWGLGCVYRSRQTLSCTWESKGPVPGPGMTAEGRPGLHPSSGPHLLIEVHLSPETTSKPSCCQVTAGVASLSPQGHILLPSVWTANTPHSHQCSGLLPEDKVGSSAWSC